MHKRYLMIGLVVLNVLAAPTLFAEDYDLVINNGRVIDPETMYDDVANVGIKDGRIATITKQNIAGRETINLDFEADPRDHATPLAMLQLLLAIDSGTATSAATS